MSRARSTRSYEQSTDAHGTVRTAVGICRATQLAGAIIAERNAAWPGIGPPRHPPKPTNGLCNERSGFRPALTNKSSFPHALGPCVWLRLREKGSSASTRNCFDSPDVDAPAIALATYEWPGRTGVARLLGERTRQPKPSQTIPLRGTEHPLNLPPLTRIGLPISLPAARALSSQAALARRRSNRRSRSARSRIRAPSPRDTCQSARGSRRGRRVTLRRCLTRCHLPPSPRKSG